jgi:hypothetical protein
VKGNVEQLPIVSTTVEHRCIPDVRVAIQHLS